MFCVLHSCSSSAGVFIPARKKRNVSTSPANLGHPSHVTRFKSQKRYHCTVSTVNRKKKLLQNSLRNAWLLALVLNLLMRAVAATKDFAMMSSVGCRYAIVNSWSLNMVRLDTVIYKFSDLDHTYHIC